MTTEPDQPSAKDRRSGNLRPVLRSHGSRYYASCEFDGPEDIATTLVDAFAQIPGVESPTESTLHESVDVEALHQLFEEPKARSRPRVIEVTFEHMGCKATITSIGGLIIDPPLRPPE